MPLVLGDLGDSLRALGAKHPSISISDMAYATVSLLATVVGQFKMAESLSIMLYQHAGGEEEAVALIRFVGRKMRGEVLS